MFTRLRPLAPLSSLTRLAAAALYTTSSPPPKMSMSTTAYTPPSPSAPFPYTVLDLTPHDSSADTYFYAYPRFVTHIDDAAIASLSEYYASALPKTGRILDLCSSWVSHYPPALVEAEKAGDLEIVGMGMNPDELARNPVMKDRWVVRDLNAQPEVGGWKGDEFGGSVIDATTCVVSIDYLTRPVELLTHLRSRTREGGMVHLVVSNRCFPTKAVRRWLQISEMERLKMVGDYLWYAGWRDIEIIDLVGVGGQEESQLQKMMRRTGMGRDPLWVVTGKKV